ncbi:UNVERIFIED_CONTAM: hypothetical protein FKN15_014563 [Acipenser sinensis]
MSRECYDDDVGLAAQCGYSLTVDFLGNAKFLASVLSCFAQNTNDETYKLTVQISVFSNSAMTSASSYVQSMTCRYSPWAEREILCERNYMEVSVRRGVPLIEPNFVQDDPDWSLAYPEATAADNSIWKIVFHLPANRKTAMTVAQAMTNGYGINTTPTRILIQSVPMAVLRSTTFYKQRWMVMMVDTAVTCPTDGTAFTEQMITWNVPRFLPPIVPTPQITTLDGQMGVDGRKLDPATIHNRDYKLYVGPQLITVKIPVGADGGYYKSHVLDNTYLISYSIEPMLQHTWQDGPNTVPKARVFNVTLGTFLPDVELVKIIVGPETLTVPEANLKGYNVQEHVFPNGSKTYTLQVPFEDPNVKQKVTPPDTRTYILPLTYLLNIVPENNPITTPFMPRPPVVTNNTVPKARVFNVTLGTFLPDVELVKIIVGPETLTVPEANLKGYNVQEHVFPNGSKTYTLQVPFEDPNVKQKVTPPDTRTYILPLTYLLNIVPENTPFTHPAVVEAILKDIIPPTVTGYCDGAAFYTMFDNTLLTYENELLFTSYRLRVVCHYLVNDTKVVQFLYQNNPAPVVQPGVGDIAVIMQLALDSTYNDFYGAQDYPVVKYLRRPLYFEIYFHCSVVICDSNRPSDSLCSRRCIPGKQRLGRSAEGMDGGAVKAFVSSGPIELKRDGSLRFMPRSGNMHDVNTIAVQVKSI